MAPLSKSIGDFQVTNTAVAGFTVSSVFHDACFGPSNDFMPSQPRLAIRKSFLSSRFGLSRRRRRQDSRNNGGSILRKASRRLLAALRRSPESQLHQHSRQVAPQESRRFSQKECSLMAPEQSPAKQGEEHGTATSNSQCRHHTWYFSSNHVLVNRERVSIGLKPMMRSISLDEEARHIAQWAAQGKDLKNLIQNRSSDLFDSVNLLVGRSIREIHEQTLTSETCCRERANLLSPVFCEFGMGTFKDQATRRLYLCQLFHSGRVCI